VKVPAIPGVPSCISVAADVVDGYARMTASVQGYACAQILGRELVAAKNPADKAAMLACQSLRELHAFLRRELLPWLQKELP
jgi:hypothetical protein